MDGRIKKPFCLIMLVIVSLFVICIAIPLVHDFLFDRFSVSNYEIKEGIVSDIVLKDKSDVETCENIIVDDYNIFVQCGKDYQQQFNIGDTTEYYVYNGKGYHTEDQMKSGSFIGKVLDFGMLGTYIVLFYLLMYNRKRLFAYIDDMAGNENSL